MAKTIRSFRVGKVQAYLRGEVWYLCYHENGRRRRPRVGSDRYAAKQLAAQINGQLAAGAPGALSFEPISLPALRDNWLQNHEVVLRSSVQTIDRYRTATEHLLRFLATRPVRHASHFQTCHAEEFVRYLRSIQVSPNGHASTAKRPLMDKGVRYILECCRALFSYAGSRRHLSPYAQNPFRALEIDRVPIENCRPIELFTPEQERAFLNACDDWQYPLFLTLLLTGLRPGELSHLLLPDDLDLEAGWLKVRNKAKLGWKVKTRNERDIPLLGPLVEVLRKYVGGRDSGPVFQRRRCLSSVSPAHRNDVRGLESILELQFRECQLGQSDPLNNKQKLRIAQRFWLALGAVPEDRIRLEFIRLTNKIGIPNSTAPKVLRHMFATILQEGRVDPLIRNELMGHVASGQRSAGHGLAMTAVYTHTRPETKRGQLEAAFASRLSSLRT